MATITKICNVKIEDDSVYYEVKWGKTWVLAQNIPLQFQNKVDDFWNNVKRCDMLSPTCSNPKKRKLSKAKQVMSPEQSKLSKTKPVTSPEQAYQVPFNSPSLPVQSVHQINDTALKFGEVVSFETVVTKPSTASPGIRGRGRGRGQGRDRQPASPTEVIKSPSVVLALKSEYLSVENVNPTSPFDKAASPSMSISGRVVLPSTSTRGRGQKNPVSRIKLEENFSSFDETVKKEMSPSKSIPLSGSSKEILSLVQNWSNPYACIIFVCRLCNKELKPSQPGNWKTHFLIHSDVKPYNCKVCGKGFVQSYRYKGHACMKTNES